MQLSGHLPVELVSVDSALVYRDMDIGTAKPDAETRLSYPHELIDIRSPDQVYSAADFRHDALLVMSEITARGKIPLLVGGTMLYFKVLIDGIATMPPADDAIRQKISQSAAEHGWQKVHDKLASVDPVAAARIHPNDSQRLQRALEVWELTGQSMTELHETQRMTANLPYNICQLAIVPPDRANLHSIIASRFQQMLQDGFVEEVTGLRLKYNLHLSLPSMKSVGYRQVWQFLEGELDRELMIHQAIVATRQLAKRQLTWLRSWQGLQEISGVKLDEALKIVRASSILS